VLDDGKTATLKVRDGYWRGRILNIDYSHTARNWVVVRESPGGEACGDEDRHDNRKT
jgi:hypothetical protein